MKLDICDFQIETIANLTDEHPEEVLKTPKNHTNLPYCPNFFLRIDIKQMTFTDLAYAHKQCKTRREIFLEKSAAVIPWQQLDELDEVVAKHYTKTTQNRRSSIISAANATASTRYASSV